RATASAMTFVVPVDGSKTSAVASGVPGVPPPTISTRPSARRVVVCNARAACIGRSAVRAPNGDLVVVSAGSSDPVPTLLHAAGAPRRARTAASATGVVCRGAGVPLADRIDLSRDRQRGLTLIRI